MDRTLNNESEVFNKSYSRGIKDKESCSGCLCEFLKSNIGLKTEICKDGSTQVRGVCPLCSFFIKWLSKGDIKLLRAGNQACGVDLNERTKEEKTA